ncbi:YsaB family lipoprotein, partial [Enterobacter asburiae]
MKYFFSGLLLLLLAGCSQQPPQPVQKAQRARITPQIT